MGARQTYALTCDGDGCEEVFFPPPRLERHEGHVSRVEIVVVPARASAVRTQAQRAGWSHLFHPGTGNGQGASGTSVGWYEDHCPACSKERTGA